MNSAWAGWRKNNRQARTTEMRGNWNFMDRNFTNSKLLIKPWITLSHIVFLDFIEGHFSQRLGDKLDNVIVIDDFVYIPLIIGAREYNDFAFVLDHLIERIK